MYMKVVCIEKAYFMHNYTIGGHYKMEVDSDCLTGVAGVDCYILDDLGRRMWWNGRDVKSYFKTLRERNLELI